MDIQILDSWDSFLDSFSPFERDVYFREEYVKLYRTKTELPVCICCSEAENYLLFPILLRSFEFEEVVYYDFETPYGYGGPISNTDDSAFIENALLAFYSFGQTNNYIAGFVRFHPLLNNTLHFDCIGKVMADRNTVSIDLQDDMDTVWMNEIHTKNRNIIKKGNKNGLQFVADYNFEYLKEFISLYNNTMDKLSADSFYYFDDQYYYQLKATLKDCFLGVILYESNVISAAIFFYSEKYGHYHLSGSNRDLLHLYPNNYMLWEAAQELKKKGVEQFHLGGGTDSSIQNSLFEFKKKFSKSLYTFQIGKIVFNPDVYSRLCASWEQENSDKKMQYLNHLLKYKY